MDTCKFYLNKEISNNSFGMKYAKMMRYVRWQKAVLRNFNALQWKDN